MEYNKTKIVELNLNDILPNRFQPRIKFKEEAILELSESIKEHGVLQPILVRPIGDRYEIVAGERRYKGAVLAGLSTIPAMIIDSNDKDSAEIALIENVQRQDLNPIEEAISYKKILDMGYLTQEQLANKLGMSQSAIANKKRLLNLTDEVQEALMEDKISERHARSLLKINDKDNQISMLKKVIKERLTVRKLDEQIDILLGGDSSILEINDNDERIVKSSITIEEQKEEEDEIIDLSDLFDDIDFDNLNILSDIKKPNSDNLEEQKEEIKEDNKEEKEEDNKKEIDDMNNRFFNTMDNSTIDNNMENNANNMNNNSSSMFSNLMSPNLSTNNDTIDEATFKKFLDPTYVDGNNNSNTPTNNGVSSNVFSKFIDDDQSTGGNQNNMMNNLLAPQSNVTEQSSNISGMLSGQTGTSNINDLLSPMSDNKPNMDNLLSPMNNSQNNNISEVNFNDVISASPMQQPIENKKPDLMSPMSSIEQSMDSYIPVQQPQKVDVLTPDTTFTDEPEPFRPIEEAPQEEDVPIFVTASNNNVDISMPSSPIIDNPDISNLLTPQNPQMIPEEPKVEVEEEEEDPINPVLTPENQAKMDMINTLNPNISGIDGNSIIIDDYNKQYDPILPTTVKTVEPTVDMKTVINMIRDLNNKIESLGFTIDTDEYDLEDVYQVVFKINKK